MQNCMNKSKLQCGTNTPPRHHAKVALVTGGAQRIGASIVRTFHAAGMNVVIHYNSSEEAASELAQELLLVRANSVSISRQDLTDSSACHTLLQHGINEFGQLDVLVNNASNFFPTPLTSANEQQWDQLINSNLKVPFFLTQAAAPYLNKTDGNIINIVDIYADRPIKDHPIYSATKAGLASLTKSFAQSLGPNIRVNGISPGAILWPEQNQQPEEQNELLKRTPLRCLGGPQDIANTALFLVEQGQYINGQIINVDGGRTVNP